MDRQSEDLLIAQSDFSQDFKHVILENHILTVADLNNLTKEQLTAIPGFTFQMLVEYREFLEANNLEIK